MASFTGLSLTAAPKTFLPIANRPLYHYIAGALSAVGVDLLIFCVNEGMQSEVAGLLAASPPSLDYRIKETGYGSGGSMLEVADMIKDATFWVVNGDLLLVTDLAKMLAYHHERRAVATAAGMQIHEASWCMERIETDVTQGIRAIHRVHPSQCKRSKLRPVGLYLFEKTVLDLIPQGRYFDLKEQLFPPLYAAGATTGVWEVPGYCRTISSIEDYFFANQDVLLGRVQLPQPSSAAAEVGSETSYPQVDPTAKLLPPTVLEGSSRIAENALVLGLTAIGRECWIGAGSIINDCVFLGKADIGRGAYLDGCVVCEDITIKSGEIFREVAIVKSDTGKRTVVPLSLRERANHNYAGAPRELEWRSPGGPGYQIAKRLLDIILSCVALIISAPLLLLIALAAKCDSPGDILLRQERHGQNGRPFTIYKFRTMAQNAPDLKRELQHFNEVDGPMFKMAADPRVTRVGRRLRASNLDELPQFWNVFKGDMSLVGPRPLSMQEMLYNPRWRDARLSVPPGITGLWQVEKHTGLNFRDWIRCDLEYVQHRSFWLDLRILFNSVYKLFPEFWQVIRNSGASRAHCG